MLFLRSESESAIYRSQGEAGGAGHESGHDECPPIVIQQDALSELSDFRTSAQVWEVV